MSYIMRTLLVLFSHLPITHWLLSAYFLPNSLLYRSKSPSRAINMPKALPPRPVFDRTGSESWTHVDIYEFLRPAVWALSSFMGTPNWRRNQELTLAALQGQALFMVSFYSLYLLFYSLSKLLISASRNVSRPSSTRLTARITSRIGSITFVSGTSRCSRSSTAKSWSASLIARLGPICDQSRATTCPLVSRSL